MSKAFICDRCGEAHVGGPEARVFLESYTLKASNRGSAVLAAHTDLCVMCAAEIKACVEQRPARGRVAAGDLVVGCKR